MSFLLFPSPPTQAVCQHVLPAPLRGTPPPPHPPPTPHTPHTTQTDPYPTTWPQARALIRLD